VIGVWPVRFAARSDLSRWYARWLSGLVATLLALATTSAAGALSSSTYGYDVTSTAATSTASRGIDSAVRPVSTPSVVSAFNYDDLLDFVATNTAAEEMAGYSGALREAAAGKGNFGIGSATSADADLMGEAWVGSNYTVASDGRTLVSADGLRQYRPPSFKPQLGKFQANFELRWQPSGAWQSNAHLDITDLAVSGTP